MLRVFVFLLLIVCVFVVEVFMCFYAFYFLGGWGGGEIGSIYQSPSMRVQNLASGPTKCLAHERVKNSYYLIEMNTRVISVCIKKNVDDSPYCIFFTCFFISSFGGHYF